MTVKPTYEELERRVQELGKMESELEYSKEMLQVYEKASLGYQSLDKNGHYITVNQTWLNTLGYTKEEVIGKSFADFIHPDWQHHFKENFPRFKFIGEILGAEFEMVKKNGDLIKVSLTGKISRNKKGDFQQTHCIFHDITQRKRTEEDLQKSEEQFRDLYDNAPVGYFEYDLRGKITRVNHAYLWMLGYTAEEVIGQPCWKFIVDEVAREQIMAKLDGVRPPAVGLERTYRRKDGTTFPVLFQDRLLLDEDGHIKGIRTAIQDITGRKDAEESLKEREESLQAILDNSPTQISEFDLEGRYIRVNAAVTKLLERHSSELVGKTFKEILPADTADQFMKRIKLVSNTCKPITVEDHLVTPEGDQHFITTIFPLFDASGRIHRIGGIANNITERKQAEAEREKLQAQLNQAQKMESVGRLAGGVAHDFNNMLGVILGHAEFALEKAELGHELHADLKEIQTAAKRSANLTKQLLTFARKDIISPKKLDLNDTVESMLNMLRRLIGEDIDLVWQPSPHLWPVKMDPSQIDQILANLSINARDAISGVGKLTIETGRKTFDEEYCKEHAGFIPGDFVLLAVSDNGCGMDKDTLDNLFEPFFTTKEVGKGTGLGLATIYGIVKQNKGFINVYSEPGQGSTFNIYLPWLVAGEDIDKTVPEKKTIAGGTETILLVEDEPTILRMTRMMLERKGYSVLSAATPTEAVGKATHHSGPIDMLMTDVVMPEMNGRDLAGQIVHFYPDIRLLFMSGYTANVIAHQGVLDDGVAFIQKPFSMADMTEKVREVLDMAPGQG